MGGQISEHGGDGHEMRHWRITTTNECMRVDKSAIISNIFSMLTEKRFNKSDLMKLYLAWHDICWHGIQQQKLESITLS